MLAPNILVDAENIQNKRVKQQMTFFGVKSLNTVGHNCLVN